jgi:cytochrome c peroxidase
MIRAASVVAAACMVLAVEACGGGGSAVSPPGSTTAAVATQGATAAPSASPKPSASATPNATPSPTPTATPIALIGGLTPASAAYLNIDITSLSNYASPVLPAYYDAQVQAADNTPANNPVTNAGATLGRVIFNDKRLSTTGTIACASCHQQALGFTDSAQFSTGVLGTPFTVAHAMRLGNVRYYQPGTMFWDKSAASVEAQAIVPIQNTPEMGWDSAHGGLTALVAKMQALPYYPELFTFVYGSSTVTVTGLQNAVAQLERSMITTNSLWDQGYTLTYSPTAPQKNLTAPLPNFTTQQNRGLQLFMAPPGQGGVGCASCHQPPTYALDPKSLDNGLDANETTIFKAPSLKNDGTGPYMHDGRFSTLAQVVAFYNSGIQPGPNLDPRLQRNGVPIQLNLSAADQAALVAFLQTLDDPALVSDPRFTSPFKQ